jgi:hypothetical protein
MFCPLVAILVQSKGKVSLLVLFILARVNDAAGKPANERRVLAAVRVFPFVIILSVQSCGKEKNRRAKYQSQQELYVRNSSVGI